MDQAFDLRAPADVASLAEHLPVIDNQTFGIPAEVFVASLEALGRSLPAEIPLRYQWGMCQIHRSILQLAVLVDLGRWFSRLEHCVGFDHLALSFRNPTQFWDSFFETRVAVFFVTRAGTTSLAFGASHEVKGRIKRPEFTVSTSDGLFVIECKRIHTDLSKLAKKFGEDFELIDALVAKRPWSESFRVEYEVLAPAREDIRTFSEKLVRKSGELVAKGGGAETVAHVKLWVMRRTEPRKIDPDSPGLHRWTCVTPGGKAISAMDPEYMRTVAHSSRVDRAVLRLVTAAIRDARTQLPGHIPGIICLADISERFTRRVFDPHVNKLGMPEHVKAMLLWDGDAFRTYVSDVGGAPVSRLLGLEEEPPAV